MRARGSVACRPSRAGRPAGLGDGIGLVAVRLGGLRRALRRVRDVLGWPYRPGGGSVTLKRRRVACGIRPGSARRCGHTAGGRPDRAAARPCDRPASRRPESQTARPRRRRADRTGRHRHRHCARWVGGAGDQGRRRGAARPHGGPGQVGTAGGLVGTTAGGAMRRQSRGGKPRSGPPAASARRLGAGGEGAIPAGPDAATRAPHRVDRPNDRTAALQRPRPPRGRSR